MCNTMHFANEERPHVVIHILCLYSCTFLNAQRIVPNKIIDETTHPMCVCVWRGGGGGGSTVSHDSGNRLGFK